MSATAATASRHPAAGFTLIEVLTVIVLMGIVMSVAVSGWVDWRKASEQESTAAELQGVMRQAQQRAVTEGTAMCVQVDAAAGTWTTYRGACTDSGKTRLTGPSLPGSPSVRLVSPSFTSGAGSGPGATFSSRGSATPGSVKVTRDGSSTVLTLRVEGLTGRVVVD